MKRLSNVTKILLLPVILICSISIASGSRSDSESYEDWLKERQRFFYLPKICLTENVRNVIRTEVIHEIIVNKDGILDGVPDDKENYNRMYYIGISKSWLGADTMYSVGLICPGGWDLSDRYGCDTIDGFKVIMAEKYDELLNPCNSSDSISFWLNGDLGVPYDGEYWYYKCVDDKLIFVERAYW